MIWSQFLRGFKSRDGRTTHGQLRLGGAAANVWCAE
ncbi:MAG: hypothetical protein RJA55_3264, partial [Acidobacteriota bacterium]